MTDRQIIDRFKDFIRDQEFPCVGAKSALGRDQLEIVVARDITSNWDDTRVYEQLFGFARRNPPGERLFQSFAVVFRGPHDLSEDAFEQRLWQRVQSLADKDAWHGLEYDATVSADPDSPHFSLSFGGEAFFVVGLHPNASRPARRFETPVLVFNLHHQFEQLRQQNRYEKLRANILDRDRALAGSDNPMLARHGEMSEARQYSGRAVDAGWTCPFTPAQAART